MSNILNGKYIKVKETQFEMVCDFLYSNGYEWCFDLESGRKYPNLITYDKHQLYIYSDYYNRLYISLQILEYYKEQLDINSLLREKKLKRILK